MKSHPKLGLQLKADQRLAVLGRMRMAEWIEMPEKEFAEEIERIEKDPLFKKLYFGGTQEPGVIRRQRWPNGRMSGSLYEMDEARVAGGEPVEVEKKLEERAALLPAIRKMGRRAFERYFVYAEEALPRDEIAKRVGLTPEEVEGIHDMLLELGAQAEFFMPARDPGMSRSFNCLASLSLEGEDPSFEFYQPYWARGMYQVRYDRLEEWKSKGVLTGEERRRLRHLLKKIETVNLRQNTLFRVLESLTKLQTEFLRSKREDMKRPISLRMLARRLDLAPSTVSRALSGRSVRLPWGKEVPLIQLVPGRRRVLREILGEWLKSGERETDARIAERLQRECGIRVSRRTVNAVRHELVPVGPLQDRDLP